MSQAGSRRWFSAVELFQPILDYYFRYGRTHGEKFGVTQGRHERPTDFGAFRESLFQHFESLSPHLQRIARHALGEPNRFALQTVAQVASEVRVQPSTLVRFAQLFGFSGYSDMQHLFRLRLLEADTALHARERESQRTMESAKTRGAAAILDALADASVLAIERLRAHIDADALREAVRLMGAAHCIHVLGRGRAAPFATCLAQGLIERHRRCHVLDSVPGMLAQQVAGMVAGDLLIAAAFDADSKRATEAGASARAGGTAVVAVTDAVVGPLARQASVHLAIREPDIDGESPLAPQIVLAQSLFLSLGHRGSGAGVDAAGSPERFDS